VASGSGSSKVSPPPAISMKILASLRVALGAGRFFDDLCCLALVQISQKPSFLDPIILIPRRGSFARSNMSAMPVPQRVSFGFHFRGLTGRGHHEHVSVFHKVLAGGDIFFEGRGFVSLLASLLARR